MSERDRFDEMAFAITAPFVCATPKTLAKDVARAIREAVAAERDACAGIAAEICGTARARMDRDGDGYDLDDRGSSSRRARASDSKQSSSSSRGCITPHSSARTARATRARRP